MTDRTLHGLPRTSAAVVLPGAPSPRIIARRRRTLQAFLTGAGLFVLGLGSLEAGVAAGLVNSANSPISFIVDQAQKSGWTSERNGPVATAVASSAVSATRHTHKRASPGAVQFSSALPRRGVCVRLCDGYFFPTGALSGEADLNGQEAACSGLCPDAPTQLFVQPAGSDKIEDAVSLSGAPYTALPVAFSHRISTDRTCSCHRHPGESFALANDPTLRGGDSIMTPKGIMVFRGTGRVPYAFGDFTTLAKASMPRDKRALLAEIERAALPAMPRRSVSWLAPPPSKDKFSFTAPTLEREKLASSSATIRFVEQAAATN
jgi:hypothetical protein